MIANVMTYTVLVSVPVATASWFVARVLRAHGRPERVVWSAALAATVLFPAFMLSRPRAAAPESRWEPVVLESDVNSTADLVTAPPAPPATQTLGADSALTAMWLLLSLGLAARWITSAVRLRSLRGSWIPETIDGVPVALTPELGPAVTGLRRPEIIVPAWVLALPPQQRILVLAHEQEHILARDPWLGTFSRICRILYPWNPATWLLGIAVQRAIELDCDRRVLRRYPSVECYGETLLVVAARGANRLVAAAAFAETDVPLRKRILAMTTPPRGMSLTRGVGVATVGVGLLSCTAVVPVPAVRVASTMSVNVDALADANDSNVERRQQSLPEPRVIANKERRWMDIHRSMADAIAGNEPLMRVPWSSRDSAFTAVYEMIGSSALYALRDSMLNGLLGDSALMRLPVGTTSVPLASDPPPPVTVSPRILNPEEIIEAIRAAYPSDLLARGRGGTVGMQFLVGPEGEIQRRQIGQISAYPALDRAAMQVASIYRFSPALEDNVPVAVWVAHAISFYPPE